MPTFSLASISYWSPVCFLRCARWTYSDSPKFPPWFSLGLDCIPSDAQKSFRDLFVWVLACIFQTSLKTGMSPSRLRTVRVVTILNPRSKLNPRYYRRILSYFLLCFNTILYHTTCTNRIQCTSPIDTSAARPSLPEIDHHQCRKFYAACLESRAG